MTRLFDAAQTQAAERAAMTADSVSGLTLMERAGRGVLEAVVQEWPDLAQGVHRAVVLCGPGNNGGDGFVVARLLHQRGWQVTVFLYGGSNTLPADAHANYASWSVMGPVRPHGNDGAAIRAHLERNADTALIVDALFGTGLTRPAQMLAGLDMKHADGTATPRIVAVDIPSGVCADSGRSLQAGEQLASVLRADLTVTFHTAKPGHYLEDGPALCGKIVVKDIGLPDSDPGDAVTLASAANLSPELMKPESGHKYTQGHALILTGGAGRTGAARLAARGALRIGAGLVTLGVPGGAKQEVASQITALMLERVDDGAALHGVLEDERINALCLGPGLGRARARDLVPVVLKKFRATVLDADALTAYGKAPGVLFGLLHARCVLTPHGGEFARLFPDIAEKMNAPAPCGPAFSKLDATRAAARRAGCVVLFKGPDTVIAAPDGRVAISSAQYDRAAPWLATAGAGDVLAGFIAGLMARGVEPMQAARTAAWLHVESARVFGPGLIAEDLPETLPSVLRGLAAHAAERRPLSASGTVPSSSPPA